MNNKTKVAIYFVMMLLSGFVLGCIVGWLFSISRYVTIIQTAGELNTDYIMVTAAHIDGNDFKGYKRIYTDEDKDLAVYINQNFKPHHPEPETIVASADFVIKGTVISTDVDGFFFEPEDNSKIKKGISGTKIYDDEGKYLGFISYVNESGEVYCLSY